MASDVTDFDPGIVGGLIFCLAMLERSERCRNKLDIDFTRRTSAMVEEFTCANTGIPSKSIARPRLVELAIERNIDKYRHPHAPST